MGKLALRTLSTHLEPNPIPTSSRALLSSSFLETCNRDQQHLGTQETVFHGIHLRLHCFLPRGTLTRTPFADCVLFPLSGLAGSPWAFKLRGRQAAWQSNTCAFTNLGMGCESLNFLNFSSSISGAPWAFKSYLPESHSLPPSRRECLGRIAT